MSPRLFFYLNELEIKAITEKMKEYNLDFEKDFDKYLQKTLSLEMEKTGFNGCDQFHCKVTKKAFNKSINKRKMDFIQCLSNKNSTTLSSAISVLLLKGFPTKP